MNGKRILYVLPYVPSPIRVRPYQLIRHLAGNGYRITVVALGDDFADPEATRDLRAICDAIHIVPHPKLRSLLNCLVSLTTEEPLWVAWGRSPEMSRLLRKLVVENDFALAHVEHLRAARFAADLGELPLAIDAVDCITALRRQMAESPHLSILRRFLAAYEWFKLRLFEPHAYEAFDQIAMTSRFDADALIALDRANRLPPVHVVPNGVDLDYFRSDYGPEAVTPKPDHVVFTGKMSYAANDDAACFLLEDILPRLRALRPEIRVTIAGSRPSPGLRALARRAGNVQVTGQVADLRPFLTSASVAICPMRLGVGIQNKALEAMAMGRPVVATGLVARGLGPEATASGAVRVAETPEELAAACVGLLSDPQEAVRAGQEGRRYVEAFHDWREAALMFEEIYEAVSVRRESL